MEVHVSINTNGSTKELQRLTDRLGDLANLLEAITDAEQQFILRCRSGFREQGDQRRVCTDIRPGERLGGNKVNTSLAAVSRADDEHEKAELIALVRQLTPKEVDRVIERMQVLLNEQQKKKEVAG